MFQIDGWDRGGPWQKKTGETMWIYIVFSRFTSGAKITISSAS